MSAHAKLSPSSAHRWMNCPSSVAMESQCTEETGSSEYADEGTAAHFLGEQCLTNNTDASAYAGRWILVTAGNAEWGTSEPTDRIHHSADARSFHVDSDMYTNVQKYVDYVRNLGGELLVEQRLSIEHLTGEPGAKGTSDAVVLLDNEIIIVDLKYGRGVKVDADSNAQLQIYALGALQEYDFLGAFTQVRHVVVQPRLDHISEWLCSVAKLDAFAKRVGEHAERCLSALTYYIKWGELHEKHLKPGTDQCRFCNAKAICPALSQHVLSTVADDFVDVQTPIAPQLSHVAERSYDNDTLGNLLGAVDLVEGWCKAVRARAESELFAGHVVPGYKLVEGRRGARKWLSEADAETALKSMRLKLEEMYDLSLISPTTAEKLHKAGAIGPRQWPKLQSLITQSDGKPSVAPESDKRPALVIQATADDFADETETIEDLV